MRELNNDYAPFPELHFNTPRHTTLENLLKSEKEAVNADYFIVHIFLNKYVSPILASETGISNRKGRSAELAAEILNHAGYYRQLMRKAFDAPTKVFMYHSTDESVTACPYYMSRYKKALHGNPEADEFMRKAFELAALAARYVPKIYVLDTGRALKEISFDYLARNHEEPGSVQILETTSLVAAQWASMPGYLVVRPGGKSTKVLSRDSLMRIMLKKTEGVLPPESYPLLLSLGGDAKTGIRNVRNWRLAASHNALRRLKRFKPHVHLSPYALFEDFPNFLDKADQDVAVLNYDIFSPKSVRFLADRTVDAAALYASMVDEPNPDAIMRLNESVLKRCPMTVETLFNA